MLSYGKSPSMRSGLHKACSRAIDSAQQDQFHISSYNKSIDRDKLNDYESSSLPVEIDSSELFQGCYEKNEGRIDMFKFDASSLISLIDDPLWQKVCKEISHQMGPGIVFKLWKCKLGSLSPMYKSISISCSTSDLANFIRQYDFVILNILRRYFPTLSELRINLVQ